MLRALLPTLVCALALGACAPPRSEQDTPEYLAACHGSPVHGAEARGNAFRQGYTINMRFDCIDKSSWEAVEQQKAETAAARRPEAIAKREAERQARIAEEEARRASEVQLQEPATAQPTPFEIRSVDVNIGSETELARIVSVGPETAADIVAERRKGRFTDWADVVHRIVGLSAAQTAAYSSWSGLTVNGQSLPGAPPNQAMATQVYNMDTYRQRRQP